MCVCVCACLCACLCVVGMCGLTGVGAKNIPSPTFQRTDVDGGAGIECVLD